jgi:hypothetical protein
MQDQDGKLVDRDSVVCAEEYQIVFWTNHFNVSEEILLEVLKQVGPKVSDVAAHLATRK